MIIREDDMTGQPTQALVRLHLSGMHASTPPDGIVSALDLSGLRAPGVTFWSAWDGDDICGMGALKHLDDHIGEVKSMRTHPAFLRKGVGRLLLTHIVGHARVSGLRQLSLETGSGPAFEPALNLYRSFGFHEGDVFGDYQPNAFSKFFHLKL